MNELLVETDQRKVVDKLLKPKHKCLKRGARTALLLLGVIGSLSVNVLTLQAVTPEQIPNSQDSLDFKGLSIPCNGCVDHGSGQCEVVVEGERQLLSCEQGAYELLLAMSAPTYSGATPSFDALRSFILQRDLPPEIVRSALMLLCKTAEGDRIVAAHATIIAPRYPTVLQKVVLEGWCSDNTWQRYWDLPKVDGVPIPASLRTAIAKRLPERIHHQEVLSSLSVSDWKSDLEELREMNEALAELKSPWLPEMKEVERRLPACGTIKDTGIVPVACSVVELDTLSPDASRYLKRVQVQQVLARLDATPDLREWLPLINSTDVKAFRTPELHRRVLQLINAGLKNTPEGIREIVLLPEYSELLQTFAKTDEAIRIRYLELSGRKVSPAGEVNNVEQSSIDTKSSGSWSPVVVVGIPLTLIVGGVLGGLASRRKKKRQVVLVPRELSNQERQELRELYNFFKLSPFAKEEDLNKAYRASAKDLHPDAGGDVRAFATLNENYRRALDLIARR